MVNYDLLFTPQACLRSEHPLSLDSAVKGLSAAQQLPMVSLLARLLESPEPQQQQGRQGEAAFGTFHSMAAHALASRCLAHGRQEHCRSNGHKLVNIALRQLQSVAAAAGAAQPGTSSALPAELLQHPTLQLELVAVLLDDEAELLQERSRCTNAGERHPAGSSTVIIQAVAAALPFMRTFLDATGMTVALGGSEAVLSLAPQVHHAVKRWHVFCVRLAKVLDCMRPDISSCQAVASGVAEALLRLAPLLLPLLPLIRRRPGGGPECVAAGSPEALLGHQDDGPHANWPRRLALSSAGLASLLLKSCMQAASTEPSAAVSSREERAAAAFAAATTACKLQWALAAQRDVPAPQLLGSSTLAVFPLLLDGLPAWCYCSTADQACAAALQALLAELHDTANPQQKVVVQRCGGGIGS